VAETRVIVPPVDEQAAAERSDRDVLRAIDHNLAYFVSLFEQMIDSLSAIPMPGLSRLKRQ
jgi:hypothetical protein